LPVTVTGARKEQAPSFRYDILPIVSKSGCNQGSCHGNSEGKGGLKLSLKGEDPAGDYEVLVRHGGGRRVNRAEPGASLLLLKATSTVPHGGGPRFKPGSEAYRTLAAWLASGALDDAPDAPRLTRLEVTPREQILVDPARMQRLTVRGRFSDGSIRNLGRLAYYSPGDPTVPVSEDGVVSFDHATDLAVLVRYADQMQSARLTFVPARKAFSWKPAPEANWIDALNFRRLKALRLQPSDLSSDTEFLRRAYLDTLGLLPNPEEARAFLKDPSPDKRARRVDALLQRPEFDDLWTMRWSDVLRVEERTLDPKGAAAYRDWIRQSIAADKPFDQFTREQLAGDLLP
ncbi:MAG TPA: DUF1549 domain-containing protein, partial [Armatimonadota bacterium]|nr:DUF1549 domain-containing protein [Armatimonadota bacterium]